MAAEGCGFCNETGGTWDGERYDLSRPCVFCVEPAPEPNEALKALYQRGKDIQENGTQPRGSE